MTTNPTPDQLVAEARRAVHKSLTLLPAWEADRVRALIADLETAVEGRTAIRMSAASVPPPADRAAILREAAAAIEAEQAREESTEWAQYGELDHETEIGGGYVRAAASLLRRMAAEEQPTTEAHPPHHRWYTETRDDLVHEWAPGMRFPDRAEALTRYRTISERHPLWKDGIPVQRRFVRETTTYTVEEPTPAAPLSAAADNEERQP